VTPSFTPSSSRLDPQARLGLKLNIVALRTLLTALKREALTGEALIIGAHLGNLIIQHRRVGRIIIAQPATPAMELRGVIEGGRCIREIRGFGLGLLVGERVRRGIIMLGRRGFSLMGG